MIKVLDCTLRDGGYCNEWKFGKNNIIRIIQGLIDAGVDIVECGFLTNSVNYDADNSKFTGLADFKKIIPQNKSNKLLVCMVNYGDYLLDNIPDYDGKSLDGIRVAFHKKNVHEALEMCQGIKDKGYKVFVQAMVSLSYSDEEFLNLIKQVNEIEPYAFYIVDSFGVMKKKDLIRLFYLVEHNLKEHIFIGYHSHNNMQLAYSNAQALVDLRTRHNLIIDSSVYGMGRGAGNLNTELFVEYLNDNLGKNYYLKPLLTIIDEILNPFYQQNYWGYSLPNYLSAKHNSHPNYAGYLDSKKTLTVENMDEIFSMMDDGKRSTYDKEYIEQLYLKYMDKEDVQEAHLKDLRQAIAGNTILIIAPGKSSEDEAEIIVKTAKQENVVSISINFEYDKCKTDYIFVSNLRRFKMLSQEKHKKCIVTSNIPAMDVYIQTKYIDLLNSHEFVRDNAGMMLIKLLVKLGARKILLAGMDGYSIDQSQNYAPNDIAYFNNKVTLEAMNKGMNDVIAEFVNQIEIDFVTKPKYIHL